METPTVEEKQKRTFKKRLSPKQKGFARDVARGKTATEAVLNHYDIRGKDPVKIASVMGVENLEKPSVIQEIENQRKSLKQALIAKGIDEDKIADKVNQLLDSEDETIVDKGLKHATSIYGVSDDKPQEKGNTYNFIQNTAIRADIKQIEDAIKAKLLGHE